MITADGPNGGWPLGLDLDSRGIPARPLLIIALDEWAGVGAEDIEQAARQVARALPVTVGTLRLPPAERLRPLLEALTVTLVPQQQSRSAEPESAEPDPAPAAAAASAWPATAGPAGADRCTVAVADVAEAEAQLAAVVDRSPQAAVVLNRLLRQTAALPVTEGLAAEAAAYSTLLAGGEFARWLAKRSAPRPVVPVDRPPVRVERKPDRLSILLNRPERRNALSVELREALFDALSVAVGDPGIDHVELSGAGPAFCSGGDLAEFGYARDLAAAYLVRLERAPWRLIEAIRDRVEVCVQGACVGAGVEMAAFAGLVRARPGSFFELPEVGMGLVPGAGGTVSVTRRIGRWRAAWMMLTGARVDPATALRWGLIDEVAGSAPL